MEIENFDTILYEGEAVPCIAYCGRSALERGEPINTWANLLWLQSVVRKHGFQESPCTPDHIAGPVVLLYGDQEFMSSVREPLLA